MIRNLLRRPVSALLSLALLAAASSARADLIGDEVTAHISFPEFVLDKSTVAVVTSPGLEFDDFGADSPYFGPQFDVDVEGSSIAITLNGFFSIAWPDDILRGLEFAGLGAASGSKIVGFTLDVSPSLAGFFGADRVDFGPNSVSVNLNNGTYFAGDRITLNLQLAPVNAVPEPSSLALVGIAGLGLACFTARHRRA